MEDKFRKIVEYVSMSMKECSKSLSSTILGILTRFPVLRRVAVETCDRAFEKRSGWNEDDAIETLRVVLRGGSFSDCRLLKHVPNELMYDRIFGRKRKERKMLSLKLIFAGSRLRSNTIEEKWFEHVAKNLSVVLNENNISHFEEEEKRLVDLCLEENVLSKEDKTRHHITEVIRRFRVKISEEYTTTTTSRLDKNIHIEKYTSCNKSGNSKIL